jgi:hypothetical protein
MGKRTEFSAFPLLEMVPPAGFEPADALGSRAIEGCPTARLVRIGRHQPPYALFRRLRGARELEVHPRMNEPSDMSDTPARPQDYAGLRAELAELASDFTPVITDLWPRLEDHKYRWELHSYGLPEGYDRQVVADVIALLVEALKSIGIADNKLLGAHAKADCHSPSSPDTA